jgi:hypothetical protein
VPCENTEALGAAVVDLSVDRATGAVRAWEAPVVL